MKQQVVFKKLDQEELIRKFSFLSLQKESITVWEKGQKSRFHFTVEGFIKGNNEILISDLSVEDHKFKSILFSFEINGVSYFGVGTFISENNSFRIKIKDEVFKSERRNNFRILTYPTHSVYVFFDVEESYPGSNVIDIHTRIRETDLFKNFLALVDEEDINESTLVYRVNDLSVTGLSFNAGINEREYFNPGKEYVNFKLHINNDVIIIPKAQIRYQEDMDKNKVDKKFEYKVGIQFLEVPEKIDSYLGSKINSLLRDFEDRNAFEDFLK